MKRVARTRTRCRRGAALMMALVCLVIVAALAAEIMRSMAAARQQSRFQRNELQAMWLAEAGLSRAATQLHESPTYRGETWQPEWTTSDATTNRNKPRGSVEIKIEPVAEFAMRRRVTVTAQYPVDSEQATRCRREQVFHLPEGEKP